MVSQPDTKMFIFFPKRKDKFSKHIKDSILGKRRNIRGGNEDNRKY